MTDGLFLRGSSLLSKWGFGDGDCLGDWWWNVMDEPVPADEHQVLRDLVRTHLVPALEAAGHVVEVYDIETIHNPIRARTLNGVEVDDYAGKTLEPEVFVTVALDDVWASIGRVQRAEVRGLSTQ